jgi:MoaA/NifB/PqqE/SkfB family radical SAM enzyme
MKLTILYRGQLSSCNYNCPYCPFAKRKESAAELLTDRQALEKFIAWVESRTNDSLSILFTPWGEALTHRSYQDALIRLSKAKNVLKVAIQTNLSCRLDWLDLCNKERLALWTTYHPSQISRQRFVSKCLELEKRGVRYSVGMVGLKSDADEIAAMRQALSPDVYLWVNAYKDEPDYYSREEIERFERIDPLFLFNLANHPSLGRDCRAGHSVISVDGEGAMRRCHFIKQPIGNIYESNFEKALVKEPCPNQVCGCHIGYVHLYELGLYETFKGGVLERIPAQRIWQQ